LRDRILIYSVATVGAVWFTARRIDLLWSSSFHDSAHVLSLYVVGSVVLFIGLVALALAISRLVPGQRVFDVLAISVISIGSAITFGHLFVPYLSNTPNAVYDTFWDVLLGALWLVGRRKTGTAKAAFAAFILGIGFLMSMGTYTNFIADAYYIDYHCANVTPCK
jgi:hypothetical protein